ncbi:hypothetical protein FIBSPDRAFT_900599 [Athelia psychrophila]|uniref:Uncharacterized protein n=1 Tax=Athelia psychrophila TaxID=1759441 RepID=A0A165Y7Y5_9AGAM|nr:hypothetical protein FIBSPDRAFT_900599 [Fibularhizoctonia sp. CBS 109695]
MLCTSLWDVYCDDAKRIILEIKAQGSHICGAIRATNQIRGDSKFSFIPWPGSKVGIARNKKKAEDLLENNCFCQWQYKNDSAIATQQQFSETSVNELYSAYLKRVKEWAGLEPGVTCCKKDGTVMPLSVTVVKGMSNEGEAAGTDGAGGPYY